VWYFWFYKASLKGSKVPFGTIGSTRPNLPSFVRPLKPLGQGQSSSTAIHLLKVSKLPFGAFGSTRPNLPSFVKAGEAGSTQAIHSHSPLWGLEAAAVWYFWFYKASLEDSKLPFGAIGSTRRNLPSFVRPLKPLGQGQSSSTVIHLLKVSKLPFGAFGFTRPNVPSLVTRLRQAVPKPFTAIHLLGLCR
jgi:hypothetical protein